MPTETNTLQPPTPTNTPEPEPTRIPITEIAILNGSTGPIYSLGWSLDGSTLASAGHSGWARGVAWSPDGDQLTSTGSDGRVVVQDTGSGERVAEFRKSSRPMWSVDWSRDGSYLALGNGVYDNRTIDGQVFILEAPPDL